MSDEQRPNAYCVEWDDDKPFIVELFIVSRSPKGRSLRYESADGEYRVKAPLGDWPCASVSRAIRHEEKRIMMHAFFSFADSGEILTIKEAANAIVKLEHLLASTVSTPISATIEDAQTAPRTPEQDRAIDSMIGPEQSVSFRWAPDED